MSEQAEATEQPTSPSVAPEDFYPEKDSASTESKESKEASETDPSKAEDSESSSESKDLADADDKSKEGEDKSAKDADVLDLKIPENSNLSDEQVEDIKAFAKENELSNEVTQAILDRENKAVSSYIENSEKESNQIIENWEKEVKSDKELGGDNLKQTVENSRRAVEQFGSESFSKLLNESGYGNNPDVIRFLNAIGEKMADDKFIQPGAKPAAERSMAEIFYGKQEN